MKLFVMTALGLSLVGCTDDSNNQPIKIGLSASLSGFDSEWGMTARDVVVASVDHVNALGGVNGRPLELVIADDGSEPEPAQAAAQQLIDAGVVGMVGGFWSNQLEAVTPMVRDARIPLLSPSSTAPELVAAPVDDGYVFRIAPNDNFQSLAIAHYLADIAAPSVGTTAIVHQDDSYGNGLSNAFTTEWVSKRGLAVTGAPITFATDMDQAAATALWTSIASANPTNVVMISGGADANILLRTWKTSGQLPNLHWFLSDAAKQSALFGDTGSELPDMTGVIGSAPTYPRSGLAFRTYSDAMQQSLGMDLSKEAYFPNAWDAVHLLAGALAQQTAKGEELGGPGLRDAIFSVSKGGQVFHAGQWRDFVASIRSGGDVDYDGAAGPVDFDADGETVSPYEVWQVQHDTSGWGFVQVDYMEAAELTAH